MRTGDRVIHNVYSDIYDVHPAQFKTGIIIDDCIEINHEYWDVKFDDGDCKRFDINNHLELITYNEYMKNINAIIAHLKFNFEIFYKDIYNKEGKL